MGMIAYRILDQVRRGQNPFRGPSAAQIKANRKKAMQRINTFRRTLLTRAIK